MKRILVAVALLVGAFSLGGQEAKVIVLQDSDSRRAKEAWQHLQQAQDEWKSVIAVDTKRYTVVSQGQGEASNTIFSPPLVLRGYACISGSTNGAIVFNAPCSGDKNNEVHEPLQYYRKGFENGFEFSSDFKYIVPKAAPTPTQGSTWQWAPATPAQGTIRW